MTWLPITLADLEQIVARELSECSRDERDLFRRASVAPAKWRQVPWGEEGGGFWAVAVQLDRVLWYNDIEHGFNVSRFEVYGEIPGNEYWCNQDVLGWALSRLQGEPEPRLGPPKPIADE